MKLGDVIKDYRLSHDLSMQEFGDRCGLSKGYISMLEKGKHPQNGKEIIPSIYTFKNIADVMGITVDSLLMQMDADQPIELSPSSSATQVPDNAAVLTTDEEHLVATYRDLNDIGQNKMLEYADDLYDNPRYKKVSTYAKIEETKIERVG